MKIHTTIDVRPLRAAAYPDIGDQLDALWKWFEDNANVTQGDPAADMLAQIKAVKAAYPKT